MPAPFDEIAVDVVERVEKVAVFLEVAVMLVDLAALRQRPLFAVLVAQAERVRHLVATPNQAVMRYFFGYAAGEIDAIGRFARDGSGRDFIPVFNIHGDVPAAVVHPAIPFEGREEKNQRVAVGACSVRPVGPELTHRISFGIMETVQDRIQPRARHASWMKTDFAIVAFVCDIRVVAVGQSEG